MSKAVGKHYIKYEGFPNNTLGRFVEIHVNIQKYRVKSLLLSLAVAFLSLLLMGGGYVLTSYVALQKAHAQQSVSVNSANPDFSGFYGLTRGDGPRIKDIVHIEGVRDNLLMGYGLIVGLNGTGDNLKNSVFTEKGLADFLGRLGVNTKGANLKTKNVAAVTITASLPPFARHGSRIDITVSTLGDAKSLEGGVLLASPLLGADGEVYALAQGTVNIGGFFAAGNTGSTVSKGVPTNGFITDGGIIEKEIDFRLNDMKQISLALRNPDVSTARAIEEVINDELEQQVAYAIDPGTVELTVPKDFQHDVVGMLASIEQLRVRTDQIARIVVDEASGTIVMGDAVKVDRVAIAQGNLLVRIDEQPYISQPLAFAEGAETVAVSHTLINVENGEESRMTILEDGASLGDLVRGLNALGVGPRDLITILQTIKAAGALQAEISVR